ncbi:hypothetical protein HDU93_000494, partial [Gonapodya sp. JEL0774]
CTLESLNVLLSEFVCAIKILYPTIPSTPTCTDASSPAHANQPTLLPTVSALRAISHPYPPLAPGQFDPRFALIEAEKERMKMELRVKKQQESLRKEKENQAKERLVKAKQKNSGKFETEIESERTHRAENGNVSVNVNGKDDSNRLQAVLSGMQTTRDIATATRGRDDQSGPQLVNHTRGKSMPGPKQHNLIAGRRSLSVGVNEPYESSTIIQTRQPRQSATKFVVAKETMHVKSAGIRVPEISGDVVPSGTPTTSSGVALSSGTKKKPRNRHSGKGNRDGWRPSGISGHGQVMPTDKINPVGVNVGSVGVGSHADIKVRVGGAEQGGISQQQNLTLTSTTVPVTANLSVPETEQGGPGLEAPNSGAAGKLRPHQVSSHAEAPVPHAPKQKKKRVGVCFKWLKRGSCPDAEHCQFRHPTVRSTDRSHRSETPVLHDVQTG